MDPLAAVAAQARTDMHLPLWRHTQQNTILSSRGHHSSHERPVSRRLGHISRGAHAVHAPPTDVWSLHVPLVCAARHTLAAVAARAHGWLRGFSAVAEAPSDVARYSPILLAIWLSLPPVSQARHRCPEERLSGRPPLFPSRGIKGPGGRVLSALVAWALPQWRLSPLAAVAACIPGMCPLAPLAAASHTERRHWCASVAATVAKVCSCPAPSARWLLAECRPLWVRARISRARTCPSPIPVLSLPVRVRGATLGAWFIGHSHLPQRPVSMSRPASR